MGGRPVSVVRSLPNKKRLSLAEACGRGGSKTVVLLRRPKSQGEGHGGTGGPATPKFTRLFPAASFPLESPACSVVAVRAAPLGCGPNGNTY